MTALAKQSHDLGVKKRKAAEPIRVAALFRRMAAKMARAEPSEFYKRWLKYNEYRPYPDGSHHRSRYRTSEDG